MNSEPMVLDDPRTVVTRSAISIDRFRHARQAGRVACAYSVTGYLLTHMAKVLRLVEVDPAPAFVGCGLSEQALLHPEARVPFDVAVRFWVECQARSGDPTLGLTIASHAREGFPTLRYAFANSPTLGDAYGRWSRFYRLMSDAGAQTLVRGPDGSGMRYDRRGGPPLPVVIEDWMVGQWLSLGRLLVGQAWVPTRVIFEHPVDGRARDYRGWFDAPVEFGADHSALEFDDAVLTLPIVGADPGLTAILDRHIQEVLTRLPAAASFSHRVRNAMARRLDGGDSGVAAIAESLHMSERTLSRRLREEGTSPRQLRQELRQELAERYLSDPSISITEVAFLLGYSESAPFHRAFKRWTGQTPASFRRAGEPRDRSEA